MAWVAVVAALVAFPTRPVVATPLTHAVPGHSTPSSARAAPDLRVAPRLHTVHGLSATGFFHVTWAEGRWWLVTPDGQPFYSSGIDHVSSAPDTDRTTGQCPYCRAIASRYSSSAAWATAQVSRLRQWGFNTLGAFSDTSGSDGAVLTSSMPYTVLLSMASGDDWFSPEFAAHAQHVAQSQCATLANDPNLVGYFLDSELHWGPDWRSTTPLLDDYLALPAGSPGRTVAETYAGDPNGFLTALASRYFAVTTAAVRAADPHHLILGVKAVARLTQPELLEAATPYVDVWSIDDYRLVPGITAFIDASWPGYIHTPDILATTESIVNRPLMIGEYSFRAADSGLSNSWPPIYPVYPTQAERAAQYRQYVTSLFARDYVVGDDWFEYVDEPQGGRFDGEDSNFGIISTSDVPYPVMTATMTVMHAIAPDRVATSGSRCISWAAVSTPVDSPDDVTCSRTATPPALPDWAANWLANAPQILPWALAGLAIAAGWQPG